MNTEKKQSNSFTLHFSYVYRFIFISFLFLFLFLLSLSFLKFQYTYLHVLTFEIYGNSVVFLKKKLFCFPLVSIHFKYETMLAVSTFTWISDYAVIQRKTKRREYEELPFIFVTYKSTFRDKYPMHNSLIQKTECFSECLYRIGMKFCFEMKPLEEAFTAKKIK